MTPLGSIFIVLFLAEDRGKSLRDKPRLLKPPKQTGDKGTTFPRSLHRIKIREQALYFYSIQSAGNASRFLIALDLAEDRGFEPLKILRPYTISSRAPSTTRPIFHLFELYQTQICLTIPAQQPPIPKSAHYPYRYSETTTTRPPKIYQLPHASLYSLQNSMLSLKLLSNGPNSYL